MSGLFKNVKIGTLFQPVEQCVCICPCSR